MKKIVIEIKGGSGKSFDLTLKVDSWIGIDGNWNSLPGYMPATKGFFEHNSSYDALYFWDRERSFVETIEYAVGDSKPPTKMYGSLSGFKSSVKKGKKGKGYIFKHGKAANKVLKDKRGFVCADITWKIKSVT